MLIVQIGFILWAAFLGCMYARKEYKNLTKEGKEQLKKELKNPTLVFHILPNIGYVLLFLGLVLNINALKFLAFMLAGIGWIIEGAEIWEANSKRGLIVVCIGSITFLITAFLTLRFLFDFSLL
ncbi:hypothetical protein [Sutcliffiella horikoshii]|uniref:hypothetical protein n=1 Tax=Sutcliffiella horikoshii TaxID=79883 RepID=UPI0038511D8A